MDETVKPSLQSELFGKIRVPAPYMAQVNRYAGAATARFGLARDRSFVAYWLNGRSLGVIKSTPVDAWGQHAVEVRVHQLDRITGVMVTMLYGSLDGEAIAAEGRVMVEVADDPIIDLDASTLESEQQERLKTFIDALLTALADRPRRFSLPIVSTHRASVTNMAGRVGR